MLILPAYTDVAVDKSSDEFLSGYITSVIERDLHWRKDSYRLQVSGGIATISFVKDNSVRREIAETQLRKIRGTILLAI